MMNFGTRGLVGILAVTAGVGLARADKTFTLISQDRSVSTYWQYDGGPHYSTQQTPAPGSWDVDLGAGGPGHGAQKSSITPTTLAGEGFSEYHCPRPFACCGSLGSASQAFFVIFRIDSPTLVRFSARIPAAYTYFNSSNRGHLDDLARIALSNTDTGSVIAKLEVTETYCPLSSPLYPCTLIDNPIDRQIFLAAGNYTFQFSSVWAGDAERVVWYPSDGRVDFNFNLSICLADFNSDGFVTGDDFDAFTDAFVSGNAAADLNNDGFVTGDDFDEYVAKFVPGC